MSTGLPQLEGKSRWITTPSTVAVLAAVAVAVLYAAAVVSFPEGSKLSFFVILGAVVLVFNFVGDALEQARLRTLRGLGDGSLAPTQAHLEQAALEVARAADVSFWTVAVLLGGGACLTGAAWWAVAQVPASTAVRVGFLGVSLAPLAAVTANLVMLPRARAVLELLTGAGLTLEQLQKALPVRFELRRRLVAYFLVVAATPVVLVTDMAASRTERLVQHMAATMDPSTARAVYEAERAQGLLPVVAMGGVIILFVLGTAWLTGSSLGSPLKALSAETERLARGEYGRPRLVPAEFEIWSAAAALGAMELQLEGALAQLRAASQGVSAATVELVSAGQLQLSGADEQSGALAATTATTEELARSARQIAANAQTVSDIARDTLTAARGGKDNADAFTGAMRQVREGNQAIADSVVRLNKRVQQVGRVIEFIDGIADKSDLLALNAELEGNKAGDVGRGFSLVAAEMRRLAESVMESTQQIAGLIEEIRDATNAAVMATEAGVKATDAGGALAQKVSDELSRIFEFANLTSDAMQSIGTSTAQQQSGTDQLASAMADILRATEAGGDVSRQLSTESRELERLAQDLEGSLVGFSQAKEDAR